MPTLKRMHQLVGHSPRAQVTFFLLLGSIADLFFMGIDGSSIGRQSMHSVAPRNLSEDHYASTLEPSLGGFGIAEPQPYESQARGFLPRPQKEVFDP